MARLFSSVAPPAHVAPSAPGATPTGPPTDIRAALRGESEALEEVILDHGQRVLRAVAIRAAGELPPLPETRLWRRTARALGKRLRERPAATHAELLYRMAREVAEQVSELTSGRREQPAETAALPLPVPRSTPRREDLELYPHRGRRTADEASMCRALENLVGDLPHLQRELVLRVDYCGHSLPEAARELELCPELARTLHRSAWRYLRRGMQATLIAG